MLPTPNSRSMFVTGCRDGRCAYVASTPPSITWEMNVCAGIISRWYTRDSVQVATVQTRIHYVAPFFALSRLSSLTDANFVLPSREDIKVAQETMPINHRIWIPNAAQDLLARLLVVAHCGSQGHHGK